jgi:hypothetical protein
MQKRIIGYVKAALLILISDLSSAAIAQTTDSTIIISTTDPQQTVTPVIRTGKPFYDIVNPERQGLRPTILYSSDDRIFVGLNYNHLTTGFKPDSSGARHRLYTHYSISQKAFSVGYQGLIHRIAGDWNLFVDAGYDWVRWINFSGLGNESAPQVEDRDFYRVRSREALVSASFHHRVGKQSNFFITPFYQSVQLLQDEHRFLTKATFNGTSLENYESNHFGGIRTDLQLQRLDNLLLPTKGVVFSVGAAHVRNINKLKAFTNYNANTRFFLPFLKRFVFAVESGAATVLGEPEFYQLNSIGGSTLRGYRRSRFWGETIFHNNNELQYLFDAPASLFKGKLGLLVFGDQGRVWKKGEQSDKWHYGYGGGIIVVPYHKVYLSVQYGISNERRGIHLQLRRAL